MSATQISVIQKFINFLEAKLCISATSHQFRKLGPRCFCYEDERDMIFVKVTDENLIIITDGENVIDHMEMIFLSGINTAEEDEKELNEVFDYYLQDILHKF